MTRREMFQIFLPQALVALVGIPSVLRAKQKPTLDPIWETEEGKFCIRLRKLLRDSKANDELSENWSIVEAALKDGWKYFGTQVSRVECAKGRKCNGGVVTSSGGKIWFRVAPITYEIWTIQQGLAK